ncbi:MAG: hypothetical protein IJM90_04580 [Firmicutes bacterium]|nr:hypothetical protein [Bacillota bacterium]
MTKLDSNEIIKLLDNLIGQTEAVGDSAQDEQIEKNLATLIDVTNWCLESVFQSSQTCGRAEGSMHRVGWRAKSALFEWEQWLEGLSYG